MMKNSGIFITFEGGEGAGKSTLVERILQEYKGQSIIVTREPGGVPLAEHIRGWLLDHTIDVPLCSRAELMLFLAARAQHIEQLIKPSLEEGKIVLCDRFNDSTVAYQGGARGLGIDYVRSLCDLVCCGVQPQLTLYLDISPEEGLRRTRYANLGSLDKIETEEIAFHHQVRESFHHLIQQEPNRIQSIDASQSSDAVFHDAMEVIGRVVTP